MKKLKQKIPTHVKSGDTFLLSSGDHGDYELDAVMVADLDFNLKEVIIDWQNNNTVETKENKSRQEIDDLELSGEGVDIVQYLQQKGIASVLTFFELHDDCLYSDDFEEEINNKNHCFRSSHPQTQ